MMQALEAEGLKKELSRAEAAAAQVQADLSAQLDAQRSLAGDAQQQLQALRHEVDTLQVQSTSSPTTCGLLSHLLLALVHRC